MEAVASITTSASVTGELVFFAKSYLSEKIKSSIGHEYALKLDSHKNVLQRNASKDLELLEALHSEIEMTRIAIHETAIGFMKNVEQEYGGEILTKWDDIHKKLMWIVRIPSSHQRTNFTRCWGAVDKALRQISPTLDTQSIYSI